MKKSLIILISVILLVLGIIFDKTIIHFIPNLHTTSLTYSLGFISFIGSALGVAILTTALFAFDKKKRKYLPVLWLTLAITFIIVLVLKNIIQRPRPIIAPLVTETGFSFPSGHAAAVFAPLVLINRTLPKLKWFWLALAILVIFSRLYLGVHYLSDVMAGALLGYIIGLFILMITKHI